MANASYIKLALTVDGGSNGILTVSSTAGLLRGATVYLSATGLTTQVLMIDEVVSTTTLAVKLITGYTYNRYNSAAYTTALSAAITQPGQADFFTDDDTTTFNGIVESTVGGFMFPDGTLQTSAAVSGATTMAAVGAVPNANAASISGVTFTLQPANGSFPGVVTTAAQTFAGAKTFSGGILTNTVGASSASSLSLFGAPTDASNAIGTLLGSSTTLADTAAKLVSVKNNATEKMYVGYGGNVVTVGTFSSSIASGQDAFSTSVTGARLNLGSGAYMYSNGARFNAPNGMSFGDDTRYIIDMGSGFLGTNSGWLAASTISSTIASGSHAFLSTVAGARWKFSTAGTTDYLFSDGLTKISAAGAFGVSGALSVSSTIQCFSGITSDGTFTNDFHQGRTSFVHLQGVQVNGASAIGVKLNSSTAYTTVGAKIASFQNNSVEKSAIGKNGQLIAPTGNADSVVGTATLVGGTVTVNTTAVAAGSQIFVSRNTPGGTSGFLSAPVASIVAATSFVINSSAGADTSTVNWWIIN